MPRSSDRLADVYARFLERQTQDLARAGALVDRTRRRAISGLARRGVHTVADLVAGLGALPLKLKLAAIDLLVLLGVRQSIPALIDATQEPAVRTAAADALGWMESRRATRFFLNVGERELASSSPDATWLLAVIDGIGGSDDPRATDLLVRIFERTDLPGSLRGDAADKLGCHDNIRDRRTRLYRRCRDTALQGLSDKSISVQFWSMYLIGALCSGIAGGQREVRADFRPALPRLRRIAASDRRLAPGYWWPMSAEAEDVIACITTGELLEPDASERWQGNPARGEMEAVGGS